MRLYNEQDVDAVQKYVGLGNYRLENITTYDDLLPNRTIYAKGVTMAFDSDGKPTCMLKDDVTSEYMGFWRNSPLGYFVKRDYRKKVLHNGSTPYYYLYVEIGGDMYKALVRLLFELETLSKDVIIQKKGSEPISEYDSFVDEYHDLTIDGNQYAIVKLMYGDESIEHVSKFDEYHVETSVEEISEEDNEDTDEVMCDKKDDEYDDSLNINLFDE